jgi:hypothetical protein
MLKWKLIMAMVLAFLAHFVTVVSTVKPHVLVMSASATPQDLGPDGGTSSVEGTVKNATTCQLVLLSKQSFGVVYAGNVRSCTSTFTAHITVGVNPSTVDRLVSFELIARNSMTTYTGPFQIVLDAASSPGTTLPPVTTTTTPPATTTTTLPPSTTVPPTTTTTTPPSPPSLQGLSSPNWSGYRVTGTFTGIRATFTVPYITTAAGLPTMWLSGSG